MATFLFWNINGNNDIADVIAMACNEHDVDLLILAECAIPHVTLLLSLNQGSPRKFVPPINYSSKLSFFTRYPVGSVRPVLDAGGIAVRTVKPPVGPELLVVAVHLPSKAFRTDAEQAGDAIETAQTITEAEARVGHLNSLIIGDLNMDPFEIGVFGAKGMHAVMDKEIAAKESRVVDGKKRLFFYNPMWGRLGDDSAGPPGTYFYRGGPGSLFWHTFDQVLLRPALLRYFSTDDLKVLTRIGARDLLRNGVIDARISDHLPLLLKLNVERSAGDA